MGVPVYTFTSNGRLRIGQLRTPRLGMNQDAVRRHRELLQGRLLGARRSASRRRCSTTRSASSVADLFVAIVATARRCRRSLRSRTVHGHGDPRRPHQIRVRQPRTRLSSLADRRHRRVRRTGAASRAAGQSAGDRSSSPSTPVTAASRPRGRVRRHAVQRGRPTGPSGPRSRHRPGAVRYLDHATISRTRFADELLDDFDASLTAE